MPAVHRYTVVKTLKVAVTAATPEDAIKVASEQTPAAQWETTGIDANKDY